MTSLHRLSPQFDPNVELKIDGSFLNLAITAIKSQIARLDADLGAHLSSLEDLQKSIQHQRDCISRAKADKAALAVSLKRHEGFLHPSPIRRLPNEVLGEVLLLTLCSLYPTPPDMDTPTFSNAPFDPVYQMRGRVLLVCWRWRLAAISEPRLWQFVKLRIERPPNLYDFDLATRHSLRWQHIQERIAWAGSLDIHLVVSHVRSSLMQDHSDIRFKIIRDLLPKLSSLHIHLDGGHLINWIYCIPEVYDKFKQLRLSSDDHLSPYHHLGLRNLLSHTSRLTWLDLPDPQGMSLSRHALSNLQFLKLKSAEAEEILTILDYATRLVSLDVPIISTLSSGMNLKTGVIVVHSRLAHLRVDNDELLEHLTLPGLKHFTHRPGRQWPTRETLQFLDRSQCELLTLDVEHDSINIGASIFSIIQTQEALTTLRMTCEELFWSIPNTFIRFFGNSASLSKLAVFRFRIFSSNTGDLRTLLCARLEAQKAGKVVRMEDWAVTIIPSGSKPKGRDKALDAIIDELRSAGSNFRFVNRDADADYIPGRGYSGGVYSGGGY